MTGCFEENRLDEEEGAGKSEADESAEPADTFVGGAKMFDGCKLEEEEGSVGFTGPPHSTTEPLTALGRCREPGATPLFAGCVPAAENGC